MARRLFFFARTGPPTHSIPSTFWDTQSGTGGMVGAWGVGCGVLMVQEQTHSNSNGGNVSCTESPPAYQDMDDRDLLPRGNGEGGSAYAKWSGARTSTRKRGLCGLCGGGRNGGIFGLF